MTKTVGASRAELVRPERLHEFAARVLRAAGMSEEDAAIAADAYIWADLRGNAPHGVTVKLDQCLSRIRGGGTKATGSFPTLSDGPGFALIDAQEAWGPIAAVRATRIAVAKARFAGVGVTVVKNTMSAGAMGYYPWLAAEEGMIGLAINNSPPLMAPWGGSSKILGNQAYALGCPAGRRPPLIFDTANSAISLTRIDGHRLAGERIPEGVALNERGEPTTDPVEALAGVLLPAGAHRGYGLALMFEVLTGILSGGDRFGSDLTMPGHVETPVGSSQFYLAIDPARVMPIERFAARVEELIDRMHASKPARGFDRVYVPGERAAAMAALRERDGIPVTEAELTGLRRWGDEYGVRLDAA